MLCALRVTWISRYVGAVDPLLLGVRERQCSRLRTKLISGTP